MKFILLAQCGASNTDKSLMDEKRLVRDNRSQSVRGQPGLQKILGEPVACNFFGVDRVPQGRGIGVRTTYRDDDRSRAMPFGHPVFMSAYIHQVRVRDANKK